MAASVPVALSPQQVADAYGLSRRAIYRAIDRGDLSASKLCGRIRISPGALAEWILRNRIEPSAPCPEVSIGDIRGAQRAGGSLRAVFERLEEEQSV